MAAPLLQFKRGVLANLPGLKAGEPGFTTDSYDLYVGLTSETSTNKFFGSHRYWTKETTSTGSGVNIVEGTSNGDNYITLKAPDSLSGIGTYVFPNTTDGSDGDFLKLTSESGGIYTLEWAAVPSGSFTLSADSGSNDTFTTGEILTFEGGEGVDTTVSDNKITFAAEAASTTNAGIASYRDEFYFTDTYKVGVVTATDSVKGIASFDSTDFTVSSGDVTLNAERIEDIVGAAITTGTQTRITVSYDDANAQYDFVVDNDLSNYDNSSSAFITASSSDTLTNKTFDANGSGNSISNLEVADFASSGITTSGDTISSNDSDTQLPTSAAVIDYVDTEIGNIDLTVSTSADSGSGSVSTSQTLTISGTSNEIETSASGQSITIGLPNDVTIGNDLTVDNNLTVTGNLYVNGSTTQVNTSSLTVEDQLIELGMVDGSAPASDLNKDIGLLLNYYSGSAKKAAVYWDDSTSRVVVSADVSESSGVLTNNTGGALEVASLYVNGCTGSTVEVIGCSDSEVVLTNVTIDGGTF